MTESDEQLIAAVAAGDREAFGALYRRRRPDVYRFALHMTGMPATAEDVVQDVFLLVIQEAKRYSPTRGTLPVPYREAVVMCDLQELLYQDAASVAGCAIGTVRSRLHRGRQMLAAKMRGERHAVRRWPARQWI